jgi:hypothetical protein
MAIAVPFFSSLTQMAAFRRMIKSPPPFPCVWRALKFGLCRATIAPAYFMESHMSLLSRWRAFALAIVAALSLSGCGYNTIPTLEENAKAKWSDVQSQYQRRADLIPNLVATVQGYAK